MTNLEQTPAGARAGLIQCLCGPLLAPDDAGAGARPPALAALAGGFACAVLSQVLSLAALPLAGAMLAPRPALAAWPLAALIAGSVASTVPASLLRSAFGRRAAFALGAALGIAGGLVAAWAVVERQFGALVLGAFWLGIAQGFGFFYRHEGAGAAASGGPRAVAAIFGAGAVAGLLAPSVVAAGDAWAAPFGFAAVLLTAALCHVLGLAVATALPASEPADAPPLDASAPHRPALALAAAAATAWFVMGHLMAHVPVGLSGCGLGFAAVSSVVAWHVIAMYAPAFAVPRLVASLGAVPTVVAGLLMVGTAGAAWLLAPPDAVAMEAALVTVGFGWCVVTVATSIRLAEVRAGRLTIAAHDTLLFAAALAGILA